MSARGRSFRLDCRPGEAPAALDLLEAEGYKFSPEPFWDSAYVLTREPRPLGSSLAASFGLIYIQDRSSMLPPLMLAPEPGSAVLDLCASPGGKSGIAAMLAGPRGFVLANEPNARRLATLNRNIVRAAAANIATCSRAGETIALADGTWPRILLDPPCSGWGAEKKHPKVRTLWRGEKIEPLARLQRRLLARAAGLLTPGGRLMYSTCTTNPDENEAQVRFAVDELGLELLPLRPPPGVDLAGPADPLCAGCLCVTGGESGGQGFFLALLARPRTGAAVEYVESKAPGSPLTRAEQEAMAYCDRTRLPPGEIRKFGEVAAFVHEKSVLAPPGFGWRAFPLGRLKGGRFHVEPHARMLVPAGPDVSAIDVDEPDPLRLLLAGRGVETLPAGGFVGLKYKGTPLGWLTVKNRRALWTSKI